MLDATKVQATDSFKCIAECLMNLEAELETTRDTLTALDDKGYGYFMGNVSNRGRYEKLVKSPFSTFVNKVITYVRPLHALLADRLQENKDSFTQYLINNNWTRADMTIHEWVIIDGRHYFGKINYRRLINTKGV
jgi:hypothetical protein